ncbi:MAG: sulfotransferase domain-containing protein [Chloroflexota bacterium]
MSKDQRSKFAIKFDVLSRIVLCNTLSGVLPLYIVTEHPKSGGTWFGQMLSSALQIPFPRNQMPRLTTSIMHGHYLYSPGLRNVFCVMRDGRDIAVSYYYHALFENERNPAWRVHAMREKFPFQDYDDIEQNLPVFIEYLLSRKQRFYRPSNFSWTQFVDSWHQRDASIVKYEDLLNDPAQELKRAIHQVTGQTMPLDHLQTIADTFSFANQAQRASGQENTRSFLRKGIAGDWKTKFSLEARQMFDYYAGDALILMGYEPDHAWVNQDIVA